MPVNLGPFIKIVGVGWGAPPSDDLYRFVFTVFGNIADSSIVPTLEITDASAPYEIVYADSGGASNVSATLTFIPPAFGPPFETIVFNAELSTPEPFGVQFEVLAAQQTFDGTPIGSGPFAVYNDTHGADDPLVLYTITLDCVNLKMLVTGGYIPDDPDDTP